MNHLRPQPPPKPGHGDVWLHVIERVLPGSGFGGLIRDAGERRAQGVRRYGTPLQYDNGRDPWVDAYQEYLDGVAYVHQARAPWYIRWGAIFFAALVRWHLPREPR